VVVSTQVRGQVNALKEIFAELAIGLALAVIVILLLLTANFQSFRLRLDRHLQRLRRTGRGRPDAPDYPVLP